MTGRRTPAAVDPDAPATCADCGHWPATHRMTDREALCCDCHHPGYLSNGEPRPAR